MAEKLAEFTIPFRMRDSMPVLYDHWIAADIFCYIRLAMGKGPERFSAGDEPPETIYQQRMCGYGSDFF